MSETTIQFDFRIGGVHTDATADSVMLSNPAGTFGVRRVDTEAIVVAAGTLLIRLSEGRYAYTFTDPEANLQYNYYVQWEYLGNTYNIEQNISGGTGGGVAPTVIPSPLPRSCITLARYAFLTGWSECAIYGVAKDGEPNGDCENPIWTPYQRESLLRFLAEAQQRIEEVVGYPLCPTYVENEYHSLAGCVVPFPVHARWHNLLAAGVRASADIAPATTIDYSVEPAFIGPIATDATSADEIHLFYPNSEREIEPSQVTLAAGSVQIWVPRCRLVSTDAVDEDGEGLDYDDLDNFLEVLDIRRVYTDTSVNAEFIYAHQATADGGCPTCGCDAGTCSEATATGCLYISNAATGAMNARRGAFSDGTWTPTTRACYCAQPSGIRLNYQAGLSQITETLETAVIRLAHSLMPTQPCGCDVFKSIWERDTNVPDFVSPERELSSWGWSDGAYFAWKTVHGANMQKKRMMVFG